MGQGGCITLVNGTPYDWQLTQSNSYQMESWGNFPAVLAAGQTAQVYVEWETGLFITSSDDSGNVTYSLTGAPSPSSFQIQARGGDGFMLQAFFPDFSVSGLPQGSTVELGWVHDGSVPFVLAGTGGNFSSSPMPTNWMHTNLPVIGGRSLRQLCIPGSHDSGMSVYTSGTTFAHDCNVLTQTTGILGQLNAGARYFDIRPVISGGQFYTGHYSKIDQLNSWQGANGQSIASIVSDVNSFTAANQELVVLYLSHDLNTDLGNASYAGLTQEDWNRLLGTLSGIANRYVIQDPGSLDLTTMALNDFIGKGAAVVIVVDPSASGISLGSYAGQGFYTPSNFPVYDSYAGTNDADGMIADQLTKMGQQRSTPGQSYFLLSWTLTQDATQAATCFLHTASSILDLASQANPLIYQRLLPACSAQTYPNILYIDNYVNPAMAALAMAVNTKAQP